LSKSTDIKSPVTIEAKSGKVLPTPVKIDLKSIDDIRLEMARVYREMRSNSIESQDGTRLVYVLAAIGKLIELHDIEKRIEMLEAAEKEKY
jgi:hypothetical protein